MFTDEANKNIQPIASLRLMLSLPPRFPQTHAAA
jgi:hypothetical protein